MSKRILIISNKFDLSCDLVILECRKRGIPYVRLNLEDAPDLCFATEIPGETHLLIYGENLSFRHDIGSVWYRRPGEVLDSTKAPPDVFTYVNDQWTYFIRGLTSIESVPWVNDPAKNSIAESKIWQLHVARKLGMRTPKTLVTNSVTKAKKFYEACSRKVIAKALYSPLIRTVTEEYFIFTNKMESMEETNLSGLNQAPVIFQEQIGDKKDIRVTIVGEKVFAAKITYEGEDVDWRRAKDSISCDPMEIPEHLQRQCVALVTSFGLYFGAIDLVFRNGVYYFLELNPNGEWGWMDDILPISSSLVDLLAFEALAFKGSEDG